MILLRRLFLRIKERLPKVMVAQLRRMTHISVVGGIIFDLTHRHYRTNGLRFSIPRHLIPLAWRAHFLFDTYEEGERKLARSWLLASDRVLEVGGCIGVVSCSINRLLRDPEAHVVVEANPHVLSWLHRNRELNACRFTVINAAVAETKTCDFSVESNMLFSCIGRGAHAVRVPGVRLTDLNDRFGPFSALVMDIEGAELEVFERQLKEMPRFRLILCELHPPIYGEDGAGRCRAALSLAGYYNAARAGAIEVWLGE